MKLEEKRNILQYVFGFSEHVISSSPLAAWYPHVHSTDPCSQISPPVLTHQMEWCASAPGVMVCGLPGWSLGEAGCIPGRWPWPFLLGHFVTTSTLYKYSSRCGSCTSPLFACAKAKIEILGGFMVSYGFSNSVSFRSRITCWFSLDLKFQVWKQNM